MNRQNLNIIGFQSLYNILYEVRDKLNFDILNFDNMDHFNEKRSSNLLSSSFIVKTYKKDVLNKLKIDKKQIINLDDFPVKLEKLIEKINIHLIKQRYNFQSKISLKNYEINLNSRTISKKNKKLKLTEREIDIILFLSDKKKSQKINILQKEIWHYSNDLETHTVETHIYRLRKKIVDTFDDKNFIISREDGYRIL